MKNPEFIEIFDTTLRDGTQGEGINLSVQDKLAITQKLDEFGVDIIEGGWPGSNPRDEAYFQKVRKLNLQHARICAFGSTARFPDKITSDTNILALVNAGTPIISIFGKTWRFHSQTGLGISDAENEDLIYNSVRFLKEHGREVVFDAEHFFDGYKDDPVFALRMLQAAASAGADTLTLCDTNGGSLPTEIQTIVSEVKTRLTTPIGIHAHNDGELAVANSIMALGAGAIQVQGTINGVGERCGNANLCSILPDLIIKMKKSVNAGKNLHNLTSLSNFVYEVMNLVPHSRDPFVGKSAFTHKGGVHVSSILKDHRMYEHIPSNLVGNQQHVIISDLSGQSNIRYKAQELGIDLPPGKEFSARFVREVKALEFSGFQFDGAEASFELLLLSELKEYAPFFTVTYAKTNVLFNEQSHKYAEVVLKVKVGDEVEHTAADGNGPVNALDKALRKALTRFYPEIKNIHLVDYKVRVLGEQDGTAAQVRVLVESSDGQTSWSTVGVSHDIIEASLQALSDSLNYNILKRSKQRETINANG